MPLILAIEPDRRQAARISSLARERLNVELLVVDSAERALATLRDRIPDLILTPHLLSPKDEAALDERLRELDSAGSKVQTLMIPVLASTGRRASGKASSLLNRLRRTKDEPATEGGCDPAVFAAQITEYLEKAADERAATAAIVEDERAYQRSDAAPPIASAPPAEVRSEPVVEAAAHYDFEFQQTAEADVEREYLPTQPAEEHIPEAFFTSSPTEPEFQDPISAVSSADREIPVAPVIREAYSDRSPEPDERFQLPDPIVVREAHRVERVPTTLEEFVEFDDLSVVDSPMVGFDELTAAMEHVEVEPINLQAFAGEAEEDAPAAIETASVLDALEILEEPEIPVAVDFQFHHRVEQPVKRAVAPPVRHAVEQPVRRAAEPPVRRAKAVAPPPPPVFDDESEPDPSPSDFDFESDLWMPLPVAAQRNWPTPEGPTVKATFTPGFDAPPDPDVEFAPPPSPEDRGSVKKRKGKPYQDEWGFFDPVQCGFAALLAKLDEVTDPPDGSGEPAKASR